MPQSPDSYVLEASRTGTLHVLFILLKSYTVLEYLVLVFGFVWFLELRKQTRENAVICPRSCHPCVQSQAGLGPPTFLLCPFAPQGRIQTPRPPCSRPAVFPPHPSLILGHWQGRDLESCSVPH